LPFLFFLPTRPPTYTLFPYTTLFRSLFLHDRAIVYRPGGPRPFAWHSAGPDCFPYARLRNVRRFAALWQSSRLFQHDKRDDSYEDRKSTRLNSSHEWISYAVFCLKKK